MPELPEVETTVRYLRPKIVGRIIKEVWTDWPKIVGNVSFSDLSKKLSGKKVSAISRRGKNILIEIERKATLWIHLKMTGHLLLRPIGLSETGTRRAVFLRKYKNSPFLEKVNQYIHFRFVLDKNEELAFSDLRKFGRVRCLPKSINSSLKTESFNELGVEPLSKKFTEKHFANLVAIKRNRSKQLKIFLMDQSAVAGIGNIYASEILFEAKLNPKRRTSSLNANETKTLYLAIKKVLKKAVSVRGTSISDFRDPQGLPGGYGDIRRVYQHKGRLCPDKCDGIVESFKQGQRTTFWCPKCQK